MRRGKGERRLSYFKRENSKEIFRQNRKKRKS